MQHHPWLLPFLHPLTTAPGLQLALPPPTAATAHPPPHHPHHIQAHHHPHHHHHHAHHQLAASTSMAGISLQPMLTPSGALLLPALQQNAAAAVAAFAAAAAAAAAASQQQQQQQQSLPPVSSAAFSMVGSPVMMAPFQRTRLKVSERENHPAEANNGTALAGTSEKRKHHEDPEPFKDVKRAKIETRALKAKRPGFSEERYNETEYYFENGLRKVYPYYFTFTTFTKGRWVGEKILDVFAREFRAHPVEEYERCIKSGTLTVNYEKVDTDYRLKHNDLLANIVHRHEIPVVSGTINIVHQDDELIVVDKPCSIPVHPCGRYRHNTVAFILAKEHNLRNLRTIHRLDRLTSGLLMFGRTQERARQMELQIRTRLVSKEYVCRVEGEFPGEETIMCTEPIEVVSYKIGVCRVSPKGKDCQTEFKRLSYNGKTSVVLCKPRTGRMHQIRVHLQYLGFPIVNDPLYNHVVFGPTKGKSGEIGKTDEQLIHDLITIHNAENWLGGEGDDFAPSFFAPVPPCAVEDAVESNVVSPADSAEPAATEQQQQQISSPGDPVQETTADPNVGPAEQADAAVASPNQPNDETPEVTDANSTYDPEKVTNDEHCFECKVRFRDPKPKDLMMFLHAWRYQGPGWSYETQLPLWAKEDWQDDESKAAQTPN